MTRVTVGYSTCGIAAGAEDTYKALEAKLSGLPNPPDLLRTGCVGMCYQEPLVEIRRRPGSESRRRPPPQEYRQGGNRRSPAPFS